MQAIDFGWLVSQNFQYHHYRPPGHDETPTNQADGSLADGSLAYHDEGTAEFVYYCWPGSPESDIVPSYATSIEGATALIFSPDGSKVLLVWERGQWSTPGGVRYTIDLARI